MFVTGVIIADSNITLRGIIIGTSHRIITLRAKTDIELISANVRLRRPHGNLVHVPVTRIHPPGIEDRGERTSYGTSQLLPHRRSPHHTGAHATFVGGTAVLADGGGQHVVHHHHHHHDGTGADAEPV